MTSPLCKTFLQTTRKQVNAKKDERIDKRYKSFSGYLAPNDKYYSAHCGHCAEVKYLLDIHNS